MRAIAALVLTTGVAIAGPDARKIDVVMAPWAGNTTPGFYGSPVNLAESVVKLPPDLSKVLDYFTPANENDLDQGDTDYGAGGALVLPYQPGPKSYLAVAAGKANPNGYTYSLVDQASPETLRVYHDGKLIETILDADALRRAGLLVTAGP